MSGDSTTRGRRQHAESGNTGSSDAPALFVSSSSSSFGHRQGGNTNQSEDRPAPASIQLKSTTTAVTVTMSRTDEPSVAAAATGGSSSTSNPQSCLQTPHTLRLLKLIHEGTPEYAETAIDRLRDTARSLGTLHLWDLLGRLTMILTTAESWKTRQAAAQALQVMAQYIPISDQTQFLEAESFHDDATTTSLDTTKTASALYLTVPELLHEHSGIDQILQYGKELWSSAEETYDGTSSTVMEDDDDDAKLVNLDRRASQDADFVQRRIRMQRSILASRLGLAALTDLLGEQSTMGNSFFVSNEDLGIVQPEQEQQKPPAQFSRKRKRPSDRQSATATTVIAADEAIQADSQNPHSIRALLVMEIQKQQQQQQQQQQKNSNNFLHSHSSPQNLLATELIYRMMDVRWHVRHGAILGVQALIHAWRNQHHHDQSPFGAWPNDVLSRCLCILAMDRFGDFANADGVVVAPVREVAGQLIALLTIQMKPPPCIQTATLKVLHRLLKHAKDWEVRHGALLAFKYMSVVLTTDAASEDSQQCLKQREKALLETMGRAAIQHLEDPSDDVKSAAAQTLLWIIRNTNRLQQMQLSDLIQDCIEPTLRALQCTRSISACWVDHVELFAVLLEREDISDLLLRISTQNSVGEDSSGKALIRLLIQLMDSDFQCVRVAALRSMARISSTSIFQASPETDTEKALLALVERLYQIFCSPKQEHEEERTKDEDFQNFLMEAWKQISELVGRSLDSANVKMLLGRLLSIYFEVGCNHKFDPDEDLRHVEAADYLAVLCGNCNLETIKDILTFSLLVFAESPWPSQFEAACLFYRALIHENFPQSCLEDFANKISMDCPPLCTHSTNDHMRKDIEKHPTLFDERFSDVLSNVLDSSLKPVDAAKIVEEFWKNYLSLNDITLIAVWPEVDLASMRIQTTMAGIALSKGLPPKITPLVRALMTSFKSESSFISRQKLTRVYIEELLHLMQFEARLDKARQKILQSLCDAAFCDVESVKLMAFQIIRKHAKVDLRSVSSVWSRLHPLLLENMLALENPVILEAVTLLDGLAMNPSPEDDLLDMLIEHFTAPLVTLACEHTSSTIRSKCSFSLISFCEESPHALLRCSIPSLILYLKEKDKECIIRDAWALLNGIVEHSAIAISPYVQCLLPFVLSTMASPQKECSQSANNIFSHLVRVAPLVQNTAGDDDHSSSDERASVIDHLIFGKPLPICTLYEDIKTCFRESNTVLRHYQLEGISWLHFLQTVNLSGVLCDSMGLGKTLQSLVGVAMAHNEGSKKENCCSLVVCPSTLVGHWYGEIEKYFPGRNVFQPLVFVGNRKQRIEKWRNMRSSANIVVTSYAFLRSDIELLSSIHWCYCILDEGHLLRNPKTATACATRLLRSQHKLVLTGTPIQNNVAEIWAIFDFLMPNFLGSADSFATNYSNPITKSIRPNASASEIAEGMKRLKILHQQVLPFILRREKSEVLQELPPKNVTVIRVPMSDTQATIYRSFCEKIEIKEYLQAFDVAVQEGNVHIPEPTSIVLKSLLFLRLLCTHPLLVLPNASHIQNTPQLNRADSSGKFLALVELLREAGIFEKCEFGADNDSSLLYCEDDLSNQETCDNFLEDPQNGATLQPRLNSTEVNIPSKCLIFAQFTRSLDLVESLLFQVHMPSLRYVRLDGNVTPAQRIKLIEAFTREPTIRVMLLTTRVGGLGLNLSCADTVILLESDFNPFADLQAIDRAHRIGTLKTVNVYRLITHGSIEEKILQLQKKKIEISNAIVNTDNSTMHSMGTDRLLDILTFRGPQTNESLLPEFGFDLEGLVEKCAEDYVNLSVNKFKENLRFK